METVIIYIYLLTHINDFLLIQAEPQHKMKWNKNIHNKSLPYRTRD